VIGLLHTLFPHDYTIQATNYRFVDRKCILVYLWPIINLTPQSNELLNYASDVYLTLYLLSERHSHRNG